MRSGDIREYVEARERETLSKYAVLSSQTRGREREIAKCPVRTDFVRDRDRIIHCKSFRRLKHKTQVFLSPVGDHYRTRLTHTLEVSQIARTISRGLRLNEDLTEAIALGHDLGHTPFGHAGEHVLNEELSAEGGFEHNRQSMRVVEKLENDGAGLNLTFEVRDGILNHTSKGRPQTLEGYVVSIADRIAYINHDIDDAIRAGVLRKEDLPASSVAVLGASHGERINSMIIDVLEHSYDMPEIRMSPEVKAEFEGLRNFMFDNVYLDAKAKREEGKGMHVIRALFAYYKENAYKLPEEYGLVRDTEGPLRAAADYIAGMTDRYAINVYENLFVPKEWM